MRALKTVCFALILLSISKNVYSQLPTFKHRGFYLHEGWFFKYPFAVKTWTNTDYGSMFSLLNQMGYDQVLLWPMVEAIPAPLSQSDSIDLVLYRKIISDAQNKGLETWMVQNANLTPSKTFGDLPWKQRVPYDSWKQVRLDKEPEASEYLFHRKKMMSILNNADAYLTIDGDPGGYAGAKPQDWLKVFLSDRKIIDSLGTHPTQQKLIPWIWSGWGAGNVWGGNPNNPPALLKKVSGPAMVYLKENLPEPWEIMPGRSHRENWANGRVNVELADSLNLIEKSTILCYEAIEFEPTPPASILQFELIRKVLWQESQYSAKAQGVFGNAQQPIMVLPNIFFFAKCSQDIKYSKKSDLEVLKDFAAFLGGDEKILIPAWQILKLNLTEIPADLPENLRGLKFTKNTAAFIPGGIANYLNTLAAEVESRVLLLNATKVIAKNTKETTIGLSNGLKSMLLWWNMHRYVAWNSPETAFSLEFVHESQVKVLKEWLRESRYNRTKLEKNIENYLHKTFTLTPLQSKSILAHLLD